MAMRLVVLCLAGLLGAPVSAAPLDEALALVSAQSATLAARASASAALANQRSWSSELDFSWYERRASEDLLISNIASGPSLRFSLRIPLFSRARDLQLAQAQLETASVRDQLQADFLAGLRELRALEGEASEARELRAFQKDRLMYQQEAVRTGKAEPETLWAEARALKAAEYSYRRAANKADALRESLARQYGGKAWQRLSRLLAVLANSPRP